MYIFSITIFPNRKISHKLKYYYGITLWKSSDCGIEKKIENIIKDKSRLT